MEEKYVDPVCGKEVTPETASDSVQYGATTYYFDSAGCRAVFESNPEKYIAQSAQQENPK